MSNYCGEPDTPKGVRPVRGKGDALSYTVLSGNEEVRSLSYEVYELGERPGWSFIFEHGGYDGFSPDDVDIILEVTGEVCREVAGYQFKNVGRLCQDFQQGRFAAAFA